MEFIESERGNQKLKIKLKTICGGQLSGGYCPAPSFSYERTTGISPSEIKTYISLCDVTSLMFMIFILIYIPKSPNQNTVFTGYEIIQSEQTSFFAKHAALRRKSKDWLARNQNNVSEWSDMSTRGLLFQ
jgi:hypothetical protein